MGKGHWNTGQSVHKYHGIIPAQEKNTTTEPGNKLGTSWSVDNDVSSESRWYNI